MRKYSFSHFLNRILLSGALISSDQSHSGYILYVGIRIKGTSCDLQQVQMLHYVWPKSVRRAMVHISVRSYFRIIMPHP
jgi:hypothetical protein